MATAAEVFKREAFASYIALLTKRLLSVFKKDLSTSDLSNIRQLATRVTFNHIDQASNPLIPKDSPIDFTLVRASLLASTEKALDAVRRNDNNTDALRSALDVILQKELARLPVSSEDIKTTYHLITHIIYKHVS